MSNRSDNFNRANSTTTLGTPSDGGSAWVADQGTWGIKSNTAYNPGGGNGDIAVLDSTTSDVDVQVTFTVLDTNQGLAGREADANNYILVQSSGAGGSYTLYKNVTGTFTPLFSNQGTANTGDVVKLSMSGSTIKVFINGTQIGTTQTVTNGQTNTRHGLRNNAAGGNAEWDDFSITDTGTVATVTGWESYDLLMQLRKMRQPRESELVIQSTQPVLLPYFDSVDAPHIPPPLVIPY